MASLAQKVIGENSEPVLKEFNELVNITSTSLEWKALPMSQMILSVLHSRKQFTVEDIKEASANLRQEMEKFSKENGYVPSMFKVINPLAFFNKYNQENGNLTNLDYYCPFDGPQVDRPEVRSTPPVMTMTFNNDGTIDLDNTSDGLLTVPQVTVKYGYKEYEKGANREFLAVMTAVTVWCFFWDWYYTKYYFDLKHAHHGENEGESKGVHGESKGVHGESKGVHGESKGVHGESKGVHGESKGKNDMKHEMKNENIQVINEPKHEMKNEKIQVKNEATQGEEMKTEHHENKH